VRELDRVFSLYIRKRDGGTCVLCGSTKNVQCGHLFSRMAYSTRWSSANCFAQCRDCNLRHEWDPYPFFRWARKTFGDDAIDSLHILYHTAVKYSDEELQMKILHYSAFREVK